MPGKGKVGGMAQSKRVDGFIGRFADLCMRNPTFGEIPDEFISAAADGELAPAMMAVARVFLLGKEGDPDERDDGEMCRIMDAILESFYLESLRRMFASDRPKTFALRDARLSDFMRIREFAFDEDEAVHSMRLKIQGILGIELSVEKTREIMQSTIQDALTFYREQQP